METDGHALRKIGDPKVKAALSAQRPVLREAVVPGRAEWEAATESYDRAAKPEGMVFPFRRFGDAVAWVQFGNGTVTIERLESLGPPGGRSAVPLLRFLMDLAEEKRFQLCGLVISYSTPERPKPSPRKLMKFYEDLGFEVVYQAADPWIFYPPRAKAT